MATIVGWVLVAVLSGAGTADAATPAVWIGSPLAAQWSESAGCPDRFPSGRCSLPQSHHTDYHGQWSVDLQGVRPGDAVVLYAAPQDGRTPTSALVEQVAPACASGNVADGGYVVKVGLYMGRQRIGHVNYAHINPTVRQGQAIPRWNAPLGTVGAYRAGQANRCWTGVHLHLEMGSQVGFSCYNRGWQPLQAMRPTNFVGFIGGNYVNGPREACP